MGKKFARARDVSKWRSHNGGWLDHAELLEQDFEWLASVERLILWNVHVPSGFLARLSKLWWLDVRGGSARDLEVARGTQHLQFLAVNQVRGLCDLSVIAEFVNLRYVSLFGLPKVKTLPSFATLSQLEHVSLGQMSGLTSIRQLLEAPRLHELQLIRKMKVDLEDAERIAKHPTIRRFGWFAEDVSNKDCVPVLERIGLPQMPIRSPEDWFSLNESHFATPTGECDATGRTESFS